MKTYIAKAQEAKFSSQDAYSVKLINRIQRAATSGQLKFDASFSVAALAAAMEVPKSELQRRVSEIFGSTTNFYKYIGLPISF